MNPEISLRLYEQVFLLALKDKEGTFFATVNYRHALAGAILAELLLLQVVQAEIVRNNKYLKWLSDRPTGDELLDECMLKIKNAQRKTQLRTWVQRFSGMPKLKQRVASQLCRKKVLKEKEERILFLFKQRVYPEVNPKPEQLILGRIEKAIFGSKPDLEPETLVLISICHVTALLPKLFERSRLKGRKQRIQQITRCDLVGNATREAIEAMQAAMMVASIHPAITASAR